MPGGAQQGIAVAGTATSLAAIDQELEPYDPARVHGYQLGLADCERMLAMLAAAAPPRPARRSGAASRPRPDDRRRRRDPGRVHAPFGLARVEYSEADILHGAAIDALSGR